MSDQPANVRSGKATVKARNQPRPVEHGWIAVATPGADLPAALAGSEAPERVLRAVDDLNAVIESLWRWIRDVHVDVLAPRAAGDEAPPRPALPFEPIAWKKGAFHDLLGDDARLRACDDQLKALSRMAEDLARHQGSQPTWLDDGYRRFMDRAVILSSSLHGLETEIWNRLASIDPLTGLETRPAMARRLNMEFERHARTGQPACVAVVDLDGFKDINDTHGHAAGDTVLRSVASLLVANLRPYDAVFRYGGDEFVICLPNADIRTAWAVLERLRRKMWRWAVPVKDQVTVQTTLSIGVASLARNGAGGPDLDRADAALYEAKRLGRNTVVISAD